MQIQFIKKDKLPLLCLNVLEHPEPEKEIGSDDWLNLVEMSQKNQKAKIKTVRKKNSGHGGKK